MNTLHAENAVIGALLIDNTKLDEVSDLKTDDFCSSIHARAYQAICRLINAGKNADIISVADYLSEGNNDPNTFVEIAEIANTPFSPANIEHYSEMVKAGSIDRKLISISNQIISSVKNKEENRLDYAQKAIADLTGSSLFKTYQAGEIIESVIKIIDERQNQQTSITGLPTGFIKLDEITHGLQPGHLIVLAARPSMGKTLFAMNIAEHVSLNEKKSVVIFSLEMNKEELLERSLSSTAKIDQGVIKTGNLTSIDWSKISSSLIESYQSSKLFIEDYSGVSLSEIRSKCRRIQREYGLSLVIIDYLSLVNGDGENETDRIGKISRAFKLLARDLNVPILLVSQLNRNLESRQDKRPMMADLRQSGSIEQDADLIIFIYRDEIYNSASECKGLAEINIAKNRHGVLGTFYLTFNGQYCRFDNNDLIIAPSNKVLGAPKSFEFKNTSE